MKVLFIFNLPLGDISLVVLLLSSGLGLLGPILASIAGVINFSLRRGSKSLPKSKSLVITIENEDGTERKITVNDLSKTENILKEIDFSS